MLIQKTKLRNLSKKFLRGYLQETFWCTVNWFGKKKDDNDNNNNNKINSNNINDNKNNNNNAGVLKRAWEK